MTRSGAGDRDATTGLYLDNERFHRTLTLPPTGTARPAALNVTYADFGHHNHERVLLICGPLFASRYVFTTKDALARQHGVRIVHLDRPGFGGTTDVGPPDRVRVWLDMVEAVLQHLAVEHVSVLGYSGGAVYAMNVLLHLRHRLHPTHPYVGLCTPWIGPARTGVSLLKLAGLLPGALVGSFDRVVQFVQASIAPAIQFSSGLAAVVPSLGQAPSDSLAPGVDAEAVALEEGLFTELLHRMNSEDTQGLGQDALLLLKREDYPGCWGSWGDYDALVPMLAQVERERCSADPGSAGATHAPLRVSVYFAESDLMIGTTTGPAWFDHCWRPEQRGDGISYSSTTVAGTNHDNILSLRYGVVERIFQDIRATER
ncbi:hypothetical protein F4802DRAFT_599351 [Xylaria palmicola]|nr:hypothetical protein F4802DRAFT_599351 [Xylaria palmicola]